MSDLSTEVRALLTRRVDARAIRSYALLLGLVASVTVLGVFIVVDGLLGL